VRSVTVSVSLRSKTEVITYIYGSLMQQLKFSSSCEVCSLCGEVCCKSELLFKCSRF